MRDVKLKRLFSLSLAKIEQYDEEPHQQEVTLLVYNRPEIDKCSIRVSNTHLALTVTILYQVKIIRSDPLPAYYRNTTGVNLVLI